MTTTHEPSILAPPRFDRQHIHRSLRGVLTLTAFLDLAVLTVAVLVAWMIRGLFHSGWSCRRCPTGSRRRRGSCSSPPGCFCSRSRAATTSATSGPARRSSGSSGSTSMITAGLVGLGCYLFQVPLSRGFVAFTFLIGTPLLLLERYTVRKWAHGVRSRGQLLHRVLAVGGASGIREVVDALGRNQHVGYRLVGACLPAGVAVEPELFPVPVVGASGTPGGCATSSGQTPCWWPGAATTAPSSCGGSPGTWRAPTSSWSSYPASPTSPVRGSTCDPSPDCPCSMSSSPRPTTRAGCPSGSSTWSVPGPRCCCCPRCCSWSPSW